MVTQDVARARHSWATGVASDEAKDLAIETDRGVRVNGPEADESDTGDGRPERLLLTAKGHDEVRGSHRQNQGYQSAAHRITSGFRYRLGF